MFDNATGTLATQPMILSAPTSFAPAGTIAVTMDTASLHTFSLIRTGSVTHGINLDQRRVPLTVASRNGANFVLQVPAHPVHVPPGTYWLFAMNAKGVPSHGHGMTRTFPL
jgi:galactose oxidase